MAAHDREGTRSYTIMYKVTGFMITLWITILLFVESIMAKNDTPLKTIYILMWTKDPRPWGKGRIIVDLTRPSGMIVRCFTLYCEGDKDFALYTVPYTLVLEGW